MSDVKKQSTTDSETPERSAGFYYPEANDGKGGTVLAETQEAADKLAAKGEFVDVTEEAEPAGKDEAK